MRRSVLNFRLVVINISRLNCSVSTGFSNTLSAPQLINVAMSEGNPVRGEREREWVGE